MRDVGRIGLGPAGGVALHDGDGKFGAGLAMRGEKALGIGEGHDRSAGGENAGGGLIAFRGDGDGFFDGAGAVARRGSGGGGEVARDLGIFLRAGHGQQVGIFRLAAREQRGRGDHAAERVVVGLVGGGAGGAAVEDGAHGDAEMLLGDVLVDGVVGEAGERVGAGVDFDFGFVGVGEAQDALGEAAEFGVGGEMRLGDGGARRLDGALRGFFRGAHWAGKPRV